ncbi:hypothetical protein BJ875DRAFT_259490 [Amylocarpus encephaloides]|uniref:BHLH domain-containing protein n=1 Tax=Amylocarpus encephaloides TaxID=45428 RepID=A0A9P7YME3_9HELO|nr:hypothetical protein BJ875DRAFT_259490 [Amylocarpus encephaloides]
MLSNFTQIPDLEFDPCWMNDDQNYPDTLASPTTPELDIDSMYTEWTANSPSKWQELPFTDPSQLSAFDEGLQFSVADALWDGFEGNFAADYQVVSVGSAGFGTKQGLSSQSKTEVNGFNLNWPPRRSNLFGKEPKSTPCEEVSTDEEYQVTIEDSVASQEIPKPRSIMKRSKKDSDSKKEPSPSSKRAKHSSLSSSDSTSTPKIRRSPSSSPPSPSDLRSNHNLIEKQYRTRLNLQFEYLLEVLPKGPPNEKRVGKAEVLTHANKYIQELRESLKVSEEKNSGLEEDVKDLESRWNTREDKPIE